MGTIWFGKKCCNEIVLYSEINEDCSMPANVRETIVESCLFTSNNQSTERKNVRTNDIGRFVRG